MAVSLRLFRRALRCIGYMERWLGVGLMAIMVGAITTQVFTRYVFNRPIFDAIGQKTFHPSEDAPAANVIKLAGNFLITTVIEGLAEAFALGRKFDIAPDAMLQVLTESIFDAPVYRTYGAMIAADKFEPAGFKLPLGLKDNRLLLAAGEAAAVPMPFASIVRDRFLTAMATGLSESDWSAIARISYDDAGVR